MLSKCSRDATYTLVAVNQSINETNTARNDGKRGETKQHERILSRDSEGERERVIGE